MHKAAVGFRTSLRSQIREVDVSAMVIISMMLLFIFAFSLLRPCTAVREFSGGFKFKDPRKFKPFVLLAKPSERLHCKSANIIISGHIRNLVLLDLADLPAGTNDNLRAVPR